MARQWRRVSLDDSKRHPLYGIKNWLALYAFGILFGPLRTLGEFSNAAHEAGLTLSQLLNADNPTGAYIKATIAFVVTISALLLWLLFSKHRNFRVVTIAVLVLNWPAYFIVLFLADGYRIPGLAPELTIQFLASILVTAVWVAYLQRSRRVRVTFENCVLVEKSGVSANQSSSMPSAASSTRTAGNDAYAAALAEIEEHRVVKGIWAQCLAESDGDEWKTKSRYIKIRAEALEGAVVRGDTQSPELADSSVVRPETKVAIGRNIKKSSSNWFGWGMLLLFGLYWVYFPESFQAYTNLVSNKLQPLAASPVQTSTEMRQWSGNVFDATQWTVGEIEAHARQFPQLGDPRAWAAVIAWQASDMFNHQKPASIALYDAVGTVLNGLNENKGVCRPGPTTIVDAASVGKVFPAGTRMTRIDCDR